ncbi:MAG: hypothetical protein CMJ50_00185 [Planctomycetaceae bacterium]|nr:hypothetical protein [Planctomycetaceae bacterium]
MEDAKRLLGWGDHAARTARRNGLAVKYAAGRSYVLGNELINYIQKHGKARNRVTSSKATARHLATGAGK